MNTKGIKDFLLKGRKKRKDFEEIKNIGDILKNDFKNIENTSIDQSSNRISWGFNDLDAMTLGLHRGSLIVIGGRPTMGKSSFAINLSKNIARNTKEPVCYFSLEDSKEQISYKFLSMETGIFHQKIRRGTLEDDERKLIEKGIEEINDLPLFVCDKGNIKVKQILTKSKKVKEKNGKGKLGLIVVDYIQRLDGPNKKSRAKELTKISIELKEIALELNVPIILLSQLSRDIENRKNHRPMLCDLRDTNSLENIADLVIMLYRDNFYNPETLERDLVELIVIKNRFGPLATTKLLFEPQYTRYRNIAA